MCMSGKRHNPVAWRNPNETFLHFEIPFFSVDVRVSWWLFLLLFSEQIIRHWFSMSQLDNLKAFDPFADASKGDEESGQEGVVHIRWGLCAVRLAGQLAIGLAIGHWQYFLYWCWLSIDCLCIESSREMEGRHWLLFRYWFPPQNKNIFCF